jgi:hypothetical protein
LWSDLQQALRVCVGANLAPDEAAPPLLEKIAALSGAPSFAAAQTRVASLQAEVRRDFEAIVGPVQPKAK